MSKIRVYELARELGLENKVVIDLCEKLGISEKSSHSSSLSGDEADKIRRSVIRQAVSAKEGLVRDIEVGEGIVTESRLGNVIRRRKKTKEELEEEQAATIDLTDAPTSSVSLSNLTPDHGAEKNSREAALARANALFKDQPAKGKEGRVDENTKRAEILEEGALATAEENTSATKMDSRGAVMASGLAKEEGESIEEDALSRARKRFDVRTPKVLGKIDLPVKSVEAKRERESKTTDVKRRDNVIDVNFGQPGDAAAKPSRTPKKKIEVVEEDEFEAARKKHRKKQILKKDELLDYDGERDVWRTKKEKKNKKGQGGSEEDIKQAVEVGPTRASKKVIKIDEEISVGEIARNMGIKVGDIITHLMNLGTMATINQLIDFDTATLIAEQFGFTTVNTVQTEDELIASLKGTDSAEDLVLRPPVVTVMGHVDHGKTSLLDAIRKTSVTKGEAGGITQHIGAYNVQVAGKGSVTFLDTPGHEAFTAMRGRGAKVTDIVVLVVAADDGVMPQTIEAINHAKAAGVAIMVAVNKIDKEGANIDRIKTQISEHGLIPEEWGGDTIIVPVSAHTKVGIDLLLENLYAQTEILELKANRNRNAMGTVIESRLDRGRGPVMTVLVQKGTLKKGDVFVAGAIFGRVRALVGDDGKTVEEAGPSIPVEILGASETAVAGDDFFVLSSETEARAIAETRRAKKRLRELGEKSGVSLAGPLTLENFSARVSLGTIKELPLIVKGDVHGSVEAVTSSLQELAHEEVKVKVIHRGVGAVSENDVQLAVASSAMIVAFNVRADTRASTVIENEGISIIYSRVIYELVDQVRKAMKGMLDPKFKETKLGRVEVRQTFRVPKLGMVAGSYVTEGLVPRNALVRLLRDNRVIFEGKVASLRRFKDDVREVAAGFECGIGIEGYSDIKDGDVMEVYKMEQIEVV